jgi:hypothetical protein
MQLSMLMQGIDGQRPPGTWQPDIAEQISSLEPGTTRAQGESMAFANLSDIEGCEAAK